MNTVPVKRALLSVSDKTGLVEFAKELVALGVELISTGGTSQALKAAHIPHQQVDEITGLPEMLDGRVKTLHPKVHGGILAKRDKHAAEIKQHQITCIDLVVVNFYPFEAAIKTQQLTWEQAVEYIDIGGPTMVRAAAKNFAWVGVVVDPIDYTQVLQELREQKGLTGETRQQLAQKVFALTAHYDAMIHHYFSRQTKAESCPVNLQLTLQKHGELRYGENPHQKACAYQISTQQGGILTAEQHQGKPLSFNNILDSEAAWTCVGEFTQPACVIVKHANPCGVAQASTIEEAYECAYEADALSAFGGVIALNAVCTAGIAKAVTDIFMEVMIAPGYTNEALAIFATKPNLRILTMPTQPQQDWEMKFITGGLLLQEKDSQMLAQSDLKIVTKVQPTQAEINAMLFAWRVLKHVKSNGILIAKNNVTVGIGAGQVSRIDSVEIALRKAGDKIKEAVLASDAFFPFRDSIDRIAQSGIRAIVQPGGSVRDEEVIAACDEYNMAMAFTGKRCFRH
jgi:phosphoribosylaminoimidazolecarboxamide formyltransferase/IMP cyclohydrolase